MVLGAGLNRSDFGYITVGELKQVTYKGWPLYYFSPEGNGTLEPAGGVLGDGKNGVFYVAKPDYSLLLGKQTVNNGADAVTYPVDEFGVSLYLNTNDGEDISNCAGGCAQTWPPFESPQYLILPSILDQSDFSTINRTDGLGNQLSYKGNPMYFFAFDVDTKGNVLGQGEGPAASFFVIEREP